MKQIIIPILLLLLISCGGNYEPGEMSERSDLIPPPQTDVSPNYWKMDENTELFHFSQGTGEPVLVLHGGPGMPYGKPWEGLESVEGYEFIYFHQRGSGKSTIPFDNFKSKNFGKNIQELESKLGLESNLADIERIRRLLNVEKLKIIGHSFGGYLAVLYAIEFPEHVDKIVLVEPADMLKFPQSHGGLSAIEQWMNENELEQYKNFMKEYFNYKDFFKKTEEELAQMNLEFGKYYTRAMLNRDPNFLLPQDDVEVKNGGFSGHAMFFSTPRRYDFRPHLKDVISPVLIIRGANDLFAKGVSEEYHSLLPQSVYTVFEHSTHFSYWEEPEKFGLAVMDFLDN